MDDLIEEISKRLGPRWVTLVSRHKFMTPNGRFQIESRYGHLKDKRPVLYHRMCCMDCLTQWLSSGSNQKLDDREKKLKLFTEMYKIADFREFVKEFADAEGIALPLEAGVDQTELAVARSKPSSPAVAESSPDFRINVNNTTRSITYEAPQTQDTLAVTANGVNVSPMLSLAGPPLVMSYGDNLTSNVGVLESSLATTQGGVHVGLPQAYATHSHNGASSVGVRYDQSIRRQGQWPTDMGRADMGMGGASRPFSRPRSSFEAPEESSVGSSGTHGSSSLSTGALGDAESTTSHYTTSEGDYSDGNLDTLTPESVLQGDIYSSRIDVTSKKHKFAILDISQRLSSDRWREIGVSLGMERDFMEQLEREEEEMDERFYAVIMKWLENGAGRRTFNDLREVIKDEEGALLVLEERLEGEEGVEILVKAIQRDLLVSHMIS